MLRKTVVVAAASMAIMGFGGAVANAFTVQDEAKFFLMGDQQESPSYKALDVEIGQLTCKALNYGLPGTKADLMAYDREHPDTAMGILGLTETEIDTLVYCPQYLLAS